MYHDNIDIIDIFFLQNFILDKHCGFANKKMKDKLLKKWGSRFTHLFLSVPKRQRWFESHHERSEHETRRCQDPPRKGKNEFSKS